MQAAATSPSSFAPASHGLDHAPSSSKMCSLCQKVERRLAAAVPQLSSLVPRDGCSPQPKGYAPATSPDTDTAFLANSVYANLANNASTPQGYYLVFSDLQASTSQSGFSGIKTLESYDTLGCQEACDATSGCTAFNIYIERDPSVDPGTNCPNPPSTVNYYCTFWSTAITNTTATNAGQWRGPEDANGQAFHVVTTASNGYVKNAAPPSYTNFTGPSSLGGSIQAPLSSTGANTYAGSTSFPGPYDPSQCAKACQSQTAYDAATAGPDGTYVPCNFFNSYVLAENNVPLGTYCTFYTQAWGPEYATNVGYTDGEGDRYTTSSSYGYTLTNQDSGQTEN